MKFPVPIEHLHEVSLLFVTIAIQISLLVAGGFLLSRFLRRSAAARHAIWLCTLSAVLLMPITLTLLPVAWLSIDIPTLATDPPGQDAAALEGSGPLVTDTLSNLSATIREAATQSQALPSSTESRAAVERPERFAHLPRLSGATAEMAAPVPMVMKIEGALLTVWFLGAIAGLIRLVIGGQLLSRLRANVTPLDAAAFGSTLNDVQERLGARSLPPIVWSATVRSPAAIGIFRPLVLLPTAIRELLSSEQIGDVLTHECAHVLRRDPLVGLLQRLAAVVFWPHPLVHYLNRQIARAREDLCDNFVLRGCSATNYAQLLLTLSTKLIPNDRPLLSYGILSWRWTLEDRVRGVLDNRRMLETRLPGQRIAAVFAVFAIALISVAGVQLVDAQAATENPPATPTAHRELPEANSSALRQQPVLADDAIIRKWVEQLAQNDPDVRIAAIQGLRRIGARATPAIPALVVLLADEKLGREARLTLARIGEPAVPALIAALKSGDTNVRWWAAQAMEEIGPSAEAAIPALIASFEDPDHPVNNAASALAGMGFLALPSIMEILEDPDSSADLRVGAAHTIWSIGPRAKEAVPLLIAALKDARKPNREGVVSVRQAAINALGSIGPDASQATAAVADFLHDEDRYVRLAAVETLGEFGAGAASAVPALIAALEDKYEETPARAAEALGEIGPPALAAAPALVDLLLRLDGEENGSRRVMVAVALGRLGSASAPVVIAAYKSADTKDQPRLIRALGEIGIEDDQVLEMLIRAIDSPNSRLRLAALKALNPRITVLGPDAQPAIPVVITALQDPDWEVRARGALTLFCLGPAAEEAIPQIIELFGDSEFQVREEAVWALFSVGTGSEIARKAIESASHDREKKVRNAASHALGQMRTVMPAQARADILHMRLFNEVSHVFPGLGTVD